MLDTATTLHITIFTRCRNCDWIQKLQDLALLSTVQNLITILYESNTGINNFFLSS